MRTRVTCRQVFDTNWLKFLKQVSRAFSIHIDKLIFTFVTILYFICIFIKINFFIEFLRSYVVLLIGVWITTLAAHESSFCWCLVLFPYYMWRRRRLRIFLTVSTFWIVITESMISRWVFTLSVDVGSWVDRAIVHSLILFT